MNKTTDSSLSERELLAFVKLVRQHYREAKIKLTPEIVERMDEIVGEHTVSQQSNPATLREALDAITRKCEQYWNESHICDAEVHAALESIHRDARIALAASGTHSLPPSIPDGSMATASGGPNVGNEYTAGWTNGRLYEAELINEEYLDISGWELVNKDKFEKHIESLKAVVRLTNEHGPIGAVAMNSEAPQKLPAAAQPQRESEPMKDGMKEFKFRGKIVSRTENFVSIESAQSLQHTFRVEELNVVSEPRQCSCPIERCDGPKSANEYCTAHPPKQFEQESEQPEQALREALKSSMVALDDWLNIHAPDLCDEQRVKEARQRVNEHGTIHYIGTVQDRNRAALSPRSEQLEQALRTYGRHRFGCAADPVKPFDVAGRCDCGFEAALSPQTDSQEPR